MEMELGFNPTLVRLRPMRLFQQTINELGFQSHAGSIEAYLAVRLAERFGYVSIPRWFD